MAKLIRDAPSAGDPPAAEGNSTPKDVVVEPGPASRDGVVRAGDVALHIGTSNSLEIPDGRLSLGKNADVARVFFTRLVSDYL